CNDVRNCAEHVHQYLERSSDDVQCSPQHSGDDVSECRDCTNNDPKDGPSKVDERIKKEIEGSDCEVSSSSQHCAKRIGEELNSSNDDVDCCLSESKQSASNESKSTNGDIGCSSQCYR